MLHVGSSNSTRSGTAAPLRVAFVDFCNLDFHALTPDSVPLGGSQSAACYLARELVAQGHQVFLISGLRAPGHYAGVESVSLEGLTQAALRAMNLDVCICLLAAAAGAELRPFLDSRVQLLLWSQHAADQSGVRHLRDPRIRGAYDSIILVSQWQATQYRAAFGIPPERISILHNAIAPAFGNEFPRDWPILSHKHVPPILAYTSTPFRGLHLLLDAFPLIRSAVQGATLRVYSGMKVYQIAAQTEAAEYGPLYEKCRQTPGVSYLGSIGQRQLASEMRDVSLFAYPNIFAETSCIAAMEAMAAGCRIVTTRLGALPETTAGFATLLDLPSSPDRYVRQFADAVITALRDIESRPDDIERLLRKQVDFANQLYTWPARAAQWVDCLRRLPPRR